MSLSYNVNVNTYVRIFKCKEECCAGKEGKDREECLKQMCDPVNHPECVEIVYDGQAKPAAKPS